MFEITESIFVHFHRKKILASLVDGEQRSTVDEWLLCSETFDSPSSILAAMSQIASFKI